MTSYSATSRTGVTNLFETSSYFFCTN